MTQVIQPTPTFLADPSVQFVSQVLDELRMGTLFVPRFQRRSVWTSDQRLELLNSIQTRIPIGSIMVWRTQLTLETRRRVGRHILPAVPKQPPGATRHYVLDGLQRLTALLSALVPAEPSVAALNDDTDDDVEEIVYDLREQVFLVRGRQVLAPHYLPTTLLLDSLRLLQFQRGLTALTDGDVLIPRADQIANAFRNYKLAVVLLVTNELEDATKAFQRINSSGTSMSEVHMVTALTYTGGFDLERTLQDARLTLEAENWGALDTKYVLATIRGHKGLDVTEPNASVLSAAIRSEPELIASATTALARAATLLRETCLIPTPFWLPYTFQVVFLAVALWDTEPSQLDAAARERFKRWFWQTTYTGYLVGTRSRTQRETLADLPRLLSGAIPIWKRVDGTKVTVLPERLDFHGARARAFALRLTTLSPRRIDGSIIDSLDVLSRHGPEALVQVFTAKVCPTRRANSPENRLLYPPEDWLSDQLLLHLKDLSSAVLESHMLTPDMLQIIRGADPVHFFAVRREKLYEWEAAFISHLGLVPET